MASKTAIRVQKAEIVKKIGRTSSDTGSPEVQIALITQRINDINSHLTKFEKDFHSRRGLLKLVGQRRKLLTYLKDTEPKRYADILEKLELRK